MAALGIVESLFYTRATSDNLYKRNFRVRERTQHIYILNGIKSEGRAIFMNQFTTWEDRISVKCCGLGPDVRVECCAEVFNAPHLSDSVG